MQILSQELLCQNTYVFNGAFGKHGTDVIMEVDTNKTNDLFHVLQTEIKDFKNSVYTYKKYL